MANYCVAWCLLISYLVLLAFNGLGIGLTVINYGNPLVPPPDPPEVNTTNVTTTTPNPFSYDRYDRDRVRTPQEVVDYAYKTHLYCNYFNDPRVYVAVPCGLGAIVSALIFLWGLCSRTFFSTTVALYSSLGLLILNAISCVVIQNEFFLFDVRGDIWREFMVITGIQGVLLFILSLQIILSIWELKRQKKKWPTMHISHLFTLNTLFFVARIVLCAFTTFVILDSRFKEGLHDPAYDKYYESDYYWEMPHIKWPAYYAFPTFIAALYGIFTASESLLSLLFGYGNAKMLWISSLLSAIFYGGIAAITSPAYLKAQNIDYHDSVVVMNWSIGSAIICLVHAIAGMVKPNALNSPPEIVSAAVRELRPTLSGNSGHLRNSVSALVNSEGLRNATSVVVKKFNGSPTLMFNSSLLVLNILSLIVLIVNFPWFWGGKLMLCGNFAMVNRVAPAVVMEAFTHKVETLPVFKELMHFLLEGILLVVGICASFDWFNDGGIGFAMVLNIILVILQFIKLGRNPAVKAAADTLVRYDNEGPATQQLISESDSVTETSSQEDEEAGGIYQPVS